MRPIEIEPVRRLSLFRDIEPENFGTLVKQALVQRFPARTELFHEGELPDFLHVVIDGSVELYGSLHDRETAVALLLSLIHI